MDPKLQNRTRTWTELKLFRFLYGS